MARKRLLTILAGAVAVVGLHVGPATALDQDADLGVVEAKVSVSEDGLEAELDLDDEDDKDKDKDDDADLKVKASKDGVDAKVGDEEVSTREVDDDASEDERDESSSSDSDQRSVRSEGEVTTAGGAQSIDEGDRQRREPLDIDRARHLIPGSEVDLSGAHGDAAAGFDLSGDEAALASPLIAEPEERSDASDWEPVAAPEAERSDAELAAIPGTGADGDAVPAGLKLLAGLLVAGTGTLWHLTRRELGSPSTARIG